MPHCDIKAMYLYGNDPSLMPMHWEIDWPDHYATNPKTKRMEKVAAYTERGTSWDEFLANIEYAWGGIDIDIRLGTYDPTDDIDPEPMTAGEMHHNSWVQHQALHS